MGDRFGSLLVDSFQNAQQGLVQAGVDVTYGYTVTNVGSVAVFDVTVVDDQLGVVPGSPIAQLDPGESASLSTTVPILGDTMNLVNVEARGADQQVCGALDSASVVFVAPPPPPGSCADGKPQAVIFSIGGGACQTPLANPQGGKASCSGDPGAAPLTLVVTKDAAKVSVSPSTGIAIGDVVTVASTSGKKLPAEIKLDVVGATGTQALKIHTSCSQPLAPGDAFGSLVVQGLIPE